MKKNVIQIRHLFKILSGSTPDSGQGFYWDGDIPWVTPEDISNLDEGYLLYDTKRKITEEGYENSGVKLVPEKSIVLTKRAPIGLLAILGIQACSNQGCFLMVPNKDVSPEYFYYYLFSKKSELQILGRGSTFMELSSDDIKSLIVPNISFSKQKSIAQFLDRETQQIDTLIKAKETLLKLLAEKKQALITRAVTKGINPNANMKDSGIDWLGEIPEHWEVKQLKFVCTSIETGGTPSQEWVEYKGIDTINWYTPVDFEDVILAESKRQLSIEAVEQMKYSLYPAGSVLVIGIGATLGKVGITPSSAYSNQQINALILRDSISSFYLGYLLGSITDVMKVWANSATLPILNQQKLGSVQVCVPMFEEQTKIVDYIDKLVEHIKHLTSKTIESIHLLKERRAALIAAAVTGEIDVN